MQPLSIITNNNKAETQRHTHTQKYRLHHGRLHGRVKSPKNKRLSSLLKQWPCLFLHFCGLSRLTNLCHHSGHIWREVHRTIGLLISCLILRVGLLLAFGLNAASLLSINSKLQCALQLLGGFGKPCVCNAIFKNNPLNHINWVAKLL